MFLNFMSNSMKFTAKQGYIKLIVQLVEQQDRQGFRAQQENIPTYIKLNLIFEDNGAGISEENLEKLFKNYSRLEEN